MNECIHHIPGRLRVRVHAVKGSAPKAHRIQREIQAMQGVRSVDVNLVTGSILIQYNPRECEVSGLLATAGLPPGSGVGFAYETAANRLGEKVLKTVANYALELALERATLALVAALL